MSFLNRFKGDPGRRPWIIACFALIFCGNLQAAVYRELWVAPSGSDSNLGTKTRPFRSIAHARDVVRTLNRKMTGDIVVYLRGGDYPVKSPVEFTAADSGRNGYRVIYQAFEKEVPVISGGVPVTGWTLDHGKVYKARLAIDGKLRTLYVNGVRAAMTHGEFTGQGPWGEFLVKGNELWAETAGKTLDGVRFQASEVPVFQNASDVELHQRKTWNFLVLGVRSAMREGDQTILTLQQPYGAIAATLAWHCNLDPAKPFTIRNAYELMKNPGEFYLNRATQTVYYFNNGEDMSKVQVIAPVSEGLLRIAGTSPTDRAHDLVFQGITFSHDRWQLEKVAGSRGMVGVQSLALYTRFREDGNWHKSHYDVCDLPQATIDVRNAQRVRFERNRFVDLGSGVAISLVNDVVDSQVSGNVFRDLSGGAVNVGHPQHYAIGGGPLFKGSAGVCARNAVKNNWIRKISLDFKQEEAISGFFTEALEISHNDISDVPYCGITLGWWWGNAEIPPSKVPKDNVIAYNRVTNTQQELPRDGGAIYVLGEQPGGRIERNYVKSPTRTLYADDGSAYWTITRNVVDPRDYRNTAEPKDGMWLFVWTPRIHDLTVDDNYATTERTRNEGVNTTPRNTHFEKDLSAEALAIVSAAGLEPAYRDIAEGARSK